MGQLRRTTNVIVAIIVTGTYLQVLCQPSTPYRNYSPEIYSAALVRRLSHVRARIPVHLAITKILGLAGSVHVEQVHVLIRYNPRAGDHPADIGPSEYKYPAPYTRWNIQINLVFTEVDACYQLFDAYVV